MAKLDVLTFPDERLRTIAEPVTVFDESLKELIADMFETMYAENGIGLAATQVNVHKQIIVMDFSDNQDDQKIFINPELTSTAGTFTNEEGCLSVPNVYAAVERAERVHIKAFDAMGQPFELDADELLSICIQHEVDHLKGILFVDYLSPFKRQRIREKLLKQTRKNKNNP
ncbi:MAG: peptide deformylase [Shewanellaceae bacterium]|nr:peptide deformylase [Shewanellaceae bacterium]